LTRGAGCSQATGNRDAELITAELAADGTVKVVGRASFGKIMAETHFQQSGLADNAKAEQLCKALGGQIAVTATILNMNTVQVSGWHRLCVCMARRQLGLCHVSSYLRSRGQNHISDSRRY
jgi:hypothetical protein